MAGYPARPEDGWGHAAHADAQPLSDAAGFDAPPLTFGDFELYERARLLLRAGEPVELGARAFDLLATLLRGRGRIVERADLMQTVWPTTIVDESNLRYQIGGLRRALGPDGGRIKNIPGRGYLFADAPPIAATLRVAASRDDILTARATAPHEPEADRLRRLETENRKLRRALLNLVARETSGQAI